MIDDVGPGGRVLLLAYEGEFVVTEPIKVTRGSTALPISIEGVDESFQPFKAVIAGDRRPWTRPADSRGATNAAGFGGGTVFEFATGVSNLAFRSLSFRNVGRIFDFSGVRGEGIEVSDTDFLNIRDGFYTDRESELSTVRLLRFNGVGYSKKAVRFHGKCSNWLIKDCELDSAWQDGDQFAVGIEAADSANTLRIEGGHTINSLDTEKGNQEHYWNGDGVASERGNFGIEIVNHLSSGNSDGGYDLKSETTSLNNCISRDNKRNFRIWGGIGLEPIRITGCQSEAPHKRGGAGGVHHLWVHGAEAGDPEAASVVFTRCRFEGGDTGTAAIHAEGNNAAVHLVDCTITSLKAGAKLFETTDPTSILLEGASQGAAARITTPIRQSSIAGARKTILLTATDAATWRIDPADLKPGIALQGSTLSLDEDTPGPLSLTVQARDRRGIALTEVINVDVLPNPVAAGTVFAIDLSGVADGTKVSDLTGLNAILINGKARVEAGALQIRGNKDFVSVDDFSVADLSGQFTIDIAFTLKKPITGQTRYLLSLWKASGNHRAMAVRLSERGEIEFAWCLSGKSADVQLLTAGTLAVGTPYRLRVDRDVHNTLRLYVDGKMVAKKDGAAGTIRSVDTPLLIGGKPTSGNQIAAAIRSLKINDQHALTGADGGYEVTTG